MSNILIVEDDKFLANAYRVKLAKAGFTIRMASDGDEAIAAMSEFTPDLIVLDLVIPKKDGFKVLTDLMAHPVWKNIPVLVASNLGQEEDVARAKTIGAKDYVIKSDLSLDDLVAKIHALLSAPASGSV